MKHADRNIYTKIAMTIQMPDLYQDPEFVRYLNNPQKNIATWHVKGEAPHHYSDIFVTYDGGEGSHSDMPGWDKICEIVTAEGLGDTYVLLHITNV